MLFFTSSTRSGSPAWWSSPSPTSQSTRGPSTATPRSTSSRAARRSSQRRPPTTLSSSSGPAGRPAWRSSAGCSPGRRDCRTRPRRASPRMAPQSPYKWFFETTTSVEGHAHAIVRTVVALRTEFQQMEILETASYGKCLVLDGRIQSSVADDFIYHETLVHPAMVLHPHPESALVIGGGEGATLREILRYPSIRRAVMVDIDQRVVEACRQHLPEMHQGAFEDRRTELRHEDARGWLERTSERFDVAIVDLTEPLEAGPACLLFTREFYQLLSDRLTPHGTLALQAGMTKLGELDF